MHVRVVSVCAAAVVLAATVVPAEEATSYVIGQYFRCNEAKEERADAIYKETAAPILEKQVKAGSLTTIGWSRHWLGGEWRRLLYMIGTDLTKMVAARDAYIDELIKQHAPVAEEMSSICPSHDDYVWAVVAGSQPAGKVGTSRPAVAMTTYFQCGASQEDEADAIVKTAFAPVFEQQVKDGKIASWAWIQHVLGGKYRRALVLDGSTHAGMLTFWNSVTPALEKAAPELGRRFNEICSSHTDYIWDLSN
jgi:hypothetical protein